MANQAIDSSGSSLGSSGLNSLLTFFLTAFRSQKRQIGRPLNYVNMQASAELSAQGQTITIPLYPTTSSYLLTDGASVTLDNTVGSSVSLSLNRHRVHKFSMTEVSQALDGNKTQEGLMLGRISGFLNDVETDVMSLATSGFTTNVVGTYGSAMTEVNLVAAMTAFYDNLPPEEMPTALVRHGTTSWGALLQLAAFRDYQVTGVTSPTANMTYMANGVGRYGAQFVVTQAMPKNGSNTDNLIFHRNALCVGMRSLPTPPAGLGVYAQNTIQDNVAFQLLVNFNSDRIATEFTLHALYGYAVGKEPWGVLFKC